jgi:hypothetical protein
VRAETFSPSRWVGAHFTRAKMCGLVLLSQNFSGPVAAGVAAGVAATSPWGWGGGWGGNCTRWNGFAWVNVCGGSYAYAW